MLEARVVASKEVNPSFHPFKNWHMFCLMTTFWRRYLC
jgi:hypothetical protein